MSKGGIAVLGFFLGFSLVFNVMGFFIFTDLQQKYDDLQQSYDSLNQSYNNLQNNYDNLQSQYNSLQSDYNSLQLKYDMMKLNYSSLKSDYNLLKSQYDSLINNINRRMGLQQYAQQFITPDDSKVKAKVKEILGNDYNGKLTWGDMNKIYNWVHNNIKYNYDMDKSASKGNVWGECWLYPSETLEKKRGDCEDQSLLFISLCLAEEKVGWIFCAELEVDGKGHMVIFINVENDMMNIYDPTNGYKSPYSMPEDQAISSYKSATGYSTVKVRTVFNHKYYKTFSSNDAFYSWF